MLYLERSGCLPVAGELLYQLLLGVPRADSRHQESHPFCQLLSLMPPWLLKTSSSAWASGDAQGTGFEALSPHSCARATSAYTELPKARTDRTSSCRVVGQRCWNMAGSDSLIFLVKETSKQQTTNKQHPFWATCRAKCCHFWEFWCNFLISQVSALGQKFGEGEWKVNPKQRSAIFFW